MFTKVLKQLLEAFEENWNPSGEQCYLKGRTRNCKMATCAAMPPLRLTPAVTLTAAAAWWEDAGGAFFSFGFYYSSL